MSKPGTRGATWSSSSKTHAVSPASQISPGWGFIEKVEDLLIGELFHLQDALPRLGRRLRPPLAQLPAIEGIPVPIASQNPQIKRRLKEMDSKALQFTCRYERLIW